MFALTIMLLCTNFMLGGIASHLSDINDRLAELSKKDLK